MKISKYFMIALSVCMIFVSTSCSQQAPMAPAEPAETADAAEPAATSDETYIAVMMQINIPYMQDHKAGLEAAARDLGVKCEFTGTTENDAAKQVDIFYQALAKKPAGIILCSIDPASMIPCVEAAREQGIPVCTVDADSPDSARLTYLGTGNYEAGWAAADVMNEILGGQGEIGCLSIPGTYAVDQRELGFRENLAANYPGMTVVSVQNDSADPQLAATATSGMLQAHPNLAAIFGIDASSAIGAAAALREAGKLGEVEILAFDKEADTLQLIKDGYVAATMVQRTFTMSYMALEFCHKYNHETLKLAEDMTGLSALPATVDTGILVVDESNVDAFIAE